MSEDKGLYGKHSIDAEKISREGLKDYIDLGLNDVYIHLDGNNVTVTSAKGIGIPIEATNSLRPAEQELINYIRTLNYGTLTIKVQHGLPERGENVRESVKFNKGGGK